MNPIYSIARKIRKKCEIFANSYRARDYDYYQNSNLACMCAVASYVLVKALRGNGIRCWMVWGRFGKWDDQHCWVETKDNIIDITATQFGGFDPVYIVAKPNGDYKMGRVISSYMQLDTWESQQPTPKIARKILRISGG